MSWLWQIATGLAACFLIDEVWGFIKRGIKAMSYSRSVDEIPTDALEAELDLRSGRLIRGKCDYCGRALGTKPECKFPERHNPSIEYILKVHSCVRVKVAKKV